VDGLHIRVELRQVLVSLMPQLQITLRFVVTVRDLFGGILEVMMLWPLLEIIESDFLFLLREFQFGIKSTAQGSVS
jgi:hypothetical protein